MSQSLQVFLQVFLKRYHLCLRRVGGKRAQHWPNEIVILERRVDHGVDAFFVKSENIFITTRCEEKIEFSTPSAISEKSSNWPISYSVRKFLISLSERCV